jgi:hypothetical protein
VLELQKDCLDSRIPISDILRKAKAIASKLELDDLSEWIDQELNGYNIPRSELPAHRKGTGSPKFFNPYNGWCPIFTQDDDFGEILSAVHMPQPVSELEDLIRGNKTGTIIYGYPAPIQQVIHSQMDILFQCGLHFSTSQIVSALDFVRNKILEWTLALERKGITGKGHSFNDTEKQEAKVVTNHIYGSNIGVLGGVAGDVSNSGFSLSPNGPSLEEVSSLISRIREAAPALPTNVRAHIENKLAVAEAELSSGSPTSSHLKAALGSIRSILEGASGNLAAAGILAALSNLAT